MKTMPPLPADEHDKKEGEWSGLASSCLRLPTQPVYRIL
jgi:hypothetical protein